MIFKPQKLHFCPISIYLPLKSSYYLQTWMHCTFSFLGSPGLFDNENMLDVNNSLFIFDGLHVFTH